MDSQNFALNKIFCRKKFQGFRQPVKLFTAHSIWGRDVRLIQVFVSDPRTSHLYKDLVTPMHHFKDTPELKRTRQ